MVLKRRFPEWGDLCQENYMHSGGANKRDLPGYKKFWTFFVREMQLALHPSK